MQFNHLNSDHPLLSLVRSLPDGRKRLLQPLGTVQFGRLTEDEEALDELCRNLEQLCDLAELRWKDGQLLCVDKLARVAAVASEMTTLKLHVDVEWFTTKIADLANVLCSFPLLSSLQFSPWFSLHTYENKFETALGCLDEAFRSYLKLVLGSERLGTPLSGDSSSGGVSGLNVLFRGFSDNEGLSYGAAHRGGLVDI